MAKWKSYDCSEKLALKNSTNNSKRVKNEESQMHVSSILVWSKNYTIPKNAFLIKKDELNKIISGSLVHIIGFELSIEEYLMNLIIHLEKH